MVTHRKLSIPLCAKRKLVLSISVAVFAATLSVVNGLNQTHAQDLSKVRTWTDSSGSHSISASLIDVNDLAVKLDTGDRVVVLRRPKLSRFDIEYLEACKILQDSAEQAEKILPQLQTNNLRGAAFVATIEAIGKVHPEGVLSNFLAGSLKASQTRTESGVKEAIRINQKAITALKTIQKHFPTAHVRTLASLYNNQAVVAARNGSVEGFANFLKLSGETRSGTLCFATHHNASLLLSSQVDLGTARTTLASVLAMGNPEPGPKLADRLMYTLEHDPFVVSFAKSPSKKSSGPVAPSDSTSDESNSNQLNSNLPAGNQVPVNLDGLRLSSSGSAFLVSSNMAMTNRHVVEDVQAFVLTNDQGFKVRASVHAISNNADVDLALLKLDVASEVKPLNIATMAPRQEDEIVALGYPLPGRYEPTLMSNRGSISKFMSDQQNFLHTATVEPGNSGGPCVDRSGHVVGVNYATDRVNEIRNYAVLPRAALSFATSNGVVLPEPHSTNYATYADTIEGCRKAVLMVHCYSSFDSNKVQNEDASEAGSVGKFALIADDCCLYCGGRTHVSCSKCVNGKRSVRKIVTLGRSVNGSPINGPKVFSVDCPSCARGRITCPGCRGTGNAP